MGLLSWIGGFIIVIWLLGFVLSFGGAMIHLLLVLAGVIFIFDFVTAKRRLK